MPFKYWRTVACATLLGVCGLAVWADDSLRGSKKTGANAPKSPAPIQESSAPTPQRSKPDAVPALHPEPPQPFIAVLAAEPGFNPPTHPSPETAPAPAPPSDEPPPLPKGKFDLPKPQLSDDRKTEPPKPALVPAKTAQAGPLELPRPSPTRIAPTVPIPAVEPTPVQRGMTPGIPAQQTPTVPFKMSLHAGGTDQPHFEITDGEVVLLKVACESVELHSQQGMTALGKIRLQGPGLNGTCDQLSIFWPTKSVELSGNVSLNYSRDGSVVQIAAEQMKLRMSGTTEPTFRSRGTSTIAPASHKSER